MLRAYWFCFYELQMVVKKDGKKLRIAENHFYNYFVEPSIRYVVIVHKVVLLLCKDYYWDS